MLRFGIIGAGNIARTHAKAIEESDRASLTAVSGGRSSREFADSYGATHHEHPGGLLASNDVDAVILATPSGVRHEYTLEAAKRGKHVLVEKPIDVELARAREMVDACERGGVTLGVVFQSRFKPHCRVLKDTLARNALGKIVLGDAYMKWYRPPEYYASQDWRGTWEYDGGGALMNQAIHTVDLLLWYLGDVTRLRSVTANRLHEGIEVEDTVIAQLEYENGGLGVIEATTAAYPGSARRIEIHGTEGTVVLVDDFVSEWELKDGTPPPPSAPEPVAASGAQSTHVTDDFRWHRAQLDDFVAAVEAGTAPLVDGRGGLRSLELVLAVYEAARTGSVVEPSRL